MLILLGLALLAVLVCLLLAGQDTLSIPLHETYFVIDRISITVVIMGPLTFLVFLGRAMTKKFKSIGPNIGLMLGLLLLSLTTFQVLRLQQNYWTEMMRLDGNGLVAGKELLVDVQTSIGWTWGLLSLWVLGIVLLIIRTVQVAIAAVKPS